MIICVNRSGIANRLIALISCIKYSNENNIGFSYYWQIINSYSNYNRHIFNCSFDKLFSNNIKLVKNVDLIKIDKLLKKTKKNIPVKYDNKYFYYHPRLLNFEWNTTFNHEYYKKVFNYKEEYLNYFKVLTLINKLQDKIDHFSSNFDEKTISVHIRSWSRRNEEGRHYKRFQNGIRRFETEMLKYKTHNFFLATDSQKVKDYFQNKSILKEKIICYPRKTNLDTSRKYPEGIQEDLIELYLLSKNKIIIGSHNSTYTEVAWWLAECPENITIL